jgi:Ca2+-binding EF-hand superfamily protein
MIPIACGEKSMISVGKPMPRMTFSILGRRIGLGIAIAIFGILCSAGPGFAADEARVENARRAFKILDMNGDKKVTYVEFANMKIDAFSAADHNEDNSLGEDEVLIASEEFGTIDRNADGKISGIEFVDSRYGQFEPYDADKNGEVDLQEFTRVLAGE